ncbi:MAG: NAD(P)/FAD-dependent oxidoreductase [Desulfarculaceae bacterium]|jgi:NADPH-dependent 2,4-dienoyl-CoA reductase/sulfur reductase-like enzyme
MKAERFPVVIVGAGLAGLTAANLLARHRVKSLLLDENLRPGGQYLRRPSLALETSANKAKRLAGAQLQGLDPEYIDMRGQLQVVGFFPPQELLVAQKGRVYPVQGDAILLAAGARERFLPFKGWTLPGVISTGGMQVLIKESETVPSGEVVIAGTGPFLLTVADDLLKRGGRIKAILDTGTPWQKMPRPAQLRGQASKLGEALSALARILRARVPIRFGNRVVEAVGNQAVEQVRVIKVDSQGQPLEGTGYTLDTSCLAIGDGFAPNIELAQLAGCELILDSNKGGWVVDTDERLETTIPGVFAAGELTGIGGALKSLCEGEIAGHSLLAALGKGPVNKGRLGRLSIQRWHHLRFSRYFNRQCALKPGLVQTISPDTIICRCEEADFGQLKDLLSQGINAPKAIKNALRMGMGRCQGRTCGPLLTDLLQILDRQILDGQTQSPPPLRVRPPIKPVLLGDLSDSVPSQNEAQAGQTK